MSNYSFKDKVSGIHEDRDKAAAVDLCRMTPYWSKNRRSQLFGIDWQSLAQQRQ